MKRRGECEIGDAVRNRMLDMLRFAAVSAVVLQHSLWVSADAGVRLSLAALGGSMWALPLLFAVSGFLSTDGGRTIDRGRRMRRLLVPYAFWSVVLFAYAAQGAVRAGESLGGINWFGVVFAGEAYYTLWFLAMLVYVTLLGSVVRSDRARVIGAGAGMLAYATLSLVRMNQPILGTDTWGGFLIIAPFCIAAYLAGAALPGVPQSRHRWVPLSVVASALVADAVLYAAWGTKLLQSQQFAVLSLGAVAALMALTTLAHAQVHGRVTEIAAWAGSFTLGVYVIHAPVLNIVRFVSHMRDSTSLAWALALWVIGTSVALGASLVIARARWARALVR